MDKTERLFKDVTETGGVPGHEDAIRAVVQKRVAGLCDELTTDNLGSLIACKKGKNPDRRILFVAHLDEVGFMVSGLTKDGYVRFLPLGGWMPAVALGQRVVIHTRNGPVTGIIGARPPHGLSAEERRKNLELKDLWIDVGVTKSFHAGNDLGIRAGDPVIPAGDFEQSANPDVYIARNWDNRAGCAVLLKIFEGLKNRVPPCSVYGAFAVQEEVGLRGAGTAAWAIDPEAAVALDVSIAHDSPGSREEDDAGLGAGVSIVVHDSTMIPNLKLRDRLIGLAEKKKIPHHLTTVQGGYDTGRVHLQKQGVASAVLGIPSRYIHGFAAMIHRGDIEAAAKLCLAFIDQATAGELNRLKKF